MKNNDLHSGIPTQAIHESYLDMQRALKSYRQAKDRGDQREVKQAHGEVQEGVLTFFELLRPHIRHEQGVADYWEGTIPEYPGDGSPPDPNDGKAILHIQDRTDVFDLPDNYQECDGLEDWHDALGLNGNRVIMGLSGQGDAVVCSLQEYQKGLVHLDDWETKYITKTKSVGGFYETKEQETVERQRIPIDRLRRAARALTEVADDMNLLSEIKGTRSLYSATDEGEEKEPYGTASPPN